MPRITCGNCGKEKAVSKFPKRGGPTYENLKPSDPRRYDSQCKLCKKPAKPGQRRNQLKEPVRRHKKKKKTKKTKKRITNEKEQTEKKQEERKKTENRVNDNVKDIKKKIK